MPSFHIRAWMFLLCVCLGCFSSASASFASDVFDTFVKIKKTGKGDDDDDEDYKEDDEQSSEELQPEEIEMGKLDTEIVKNEVLYIAVIIILGVIAGLIAIGWILHCIFARKKKVYDEESPPPIDYKQKHNEYWYLLEESRRIYNEYLSSSSLCPVNVDQQALITEDMLKTPSPDLFNSQQLQIFNLMKFDSYARFVKSPLYQECMMAEVEGRPLPNLNLSPTIPVTSCHALASGAVKKNNLKAGKSLPVGVEGTDIETVTDKSHRRSFKKKDRKGHSKEALDSNGLSSRRESGVSLNSNTSLELGLNSSLTSKFENVGGSTGCTDTEADTKSVKYCCVYLPDGTASLTAVKPGLTIRDMLTGVCEKRGYCLSDVKVFLVGNEQKALALDQDCLVLTEQEVRLENWISFELQIKTMNKSVQIVSKPTKTIEEALPSILKKYGLENQHIVLTKTGQSHALDEKSYVNEVAGQKLDLEVVHFSDPRKAVGTTVEQHTKEHREDKGIPMTEHYHRAQNEPNNVSQVSSEHRHSEAPHGKHKPHQHKYDIEGLVELLNKVQSTRADDQRGLLCKEDLVLPEFLKLPTDNEYCHCNMASADESAVITTNAPHFLDPSQASESCREYNCSTNSIRSTFKKECLAESQANTAKGVTSLYDGTLVNTEMKPEVSVSDSTCSRYTSAEKPL